MTASTPEIDLEQLDHARSGGATVVDVREVAEYAAGYDAYSVAGGTAAWARSGRALETGDLRTN